MTQLRSRSIIPDQLTGHALNPRVSPWSVVVPEATTNLITNPSFETEIGPNWTVNGTASAGRVSNYAAIGAYSLNVTATSNGTGALYVTGSNTTAGVIYTASFWARGYKDIRVTFFSTFGQVSSPIMTLTQEWRRFSFTAAWLGGSGRNLYIIQAGSGTSNF